MQPKAGRLDLLLLDPESLRRYEVEIQLGKTDETHIIRTIEYWDIEKKRYPQYDHCAVIIAEDITSRFLNVISLFNGFIPIIAIQMNAFKFGDDVALIFTKILNEMPLGLVDEDEEKESQPSSVNREFWINRGRNEQLQIADKVLEIMNETGSNNQFKYSKVNLRFLRNGQLVHPVRIRLKKTNHILLVLITQKSEEIDSIIEKNDFEDMGYSANRYRILVSNEDVTTKREALKELLFITEKKYNEEG